MIEPYDLFTHLFIPVLHGQPGLVFISRLVCIWAKITNYTYCTDNVEYLLFSIIHITQQNVDICGTI